MSRVFKSSFCLAALVILASIPAGAADADSMACVEQIERVCAGVENRLESCLSDRGNQLSAACRDELKTALSLIQDPTGPAACIPDVQRLCPDRKAEALAHCIADELPHFSDACQNYIRKVRPE